MNYALYVRLHGRETWYAYVYSEHELEEIIRTIKKLDGCKKYIYLNNNHGMLPNGKFVIRKFSNFKQVIPKKHQIRVETVNKKIEDTESVIDATAMLFSPRNR
jgi:uncharacterized protein YecE (DUF72 family)